MPTPYAEPALAYAVALAELGSAATPSQQAASTGGGINSNADAKVGVDLNATPAAITTAINVNVPTDGVVLCVGLCVAQVGAAGPANGVGAVTLQVDGTQVTTSNFGAPNVVELQILQGTLVFLAAGLSPGEHQFQLFATCNAAAVAGTVGGTYLAAIALPNAS